MSGKCIEKLSHSCGSSDGLQVFLGDDGEYTGFCFRCKTFVQNPYEDKGNDYKPPFPKRKTEEDVKREIEEILSYKNLAIPSRKLSKEAVEYFDCKVAVSETDGRTPMVVYFPYSIQGDLVAYKARILDTKQMWFVGKAAGVDLFGWEQARVTGAKTLFVTEGEFDALAMYDIHRQCTRGTKYEDLSPAIVSIPTGAASAAKVLTSKLKDIRDNFKEIVLLFDMDEAGEQAVKDVLRVIPDAKRAILPSKDINECLINGQIKKVYNDALFNAKTPKNTRIIKGESLHAIAKEPPKYGASWPFKGLTEKTRGMRLGETVYVGAAPKMGKSELVNELAKHCIVEHGWKVFLVKPEETNKKTYQLLAGKVARKFFHDPKRPFDLEAFEEAGEVLDGKVHMLDIYQHVGWETLKADIREAAMDGCKAIFIDPITNLVNGLDSGEQNTKLQEISQELAAMAKDLNVIIFIFCHLRNPDSGLPHERGGKVLSSQFAGSRAMMRSCNLMLGLEGNKDPDLPPEERNVRRLVILEDREYGETGVILLYWDENTGAFNEM